MSHEGTSLAVRYARLYVKLKAIGHSAAIALTVLQDAKRGDKFSLKWCRMARIMK